MIESNVTNKVQEKQQEKRFLDIGSGSGLFSLAARNLGASIVSFDYDGQSVACTQELKQRYWLETEEWGGRGGGRARQ